MSPSVTPDEPPQACTQLQNAQAKLKPSFGTFKANLNLSITGIGVSYPPHQLTPSVLDTLCERHYPDTPAMRKIRSINNYTGILSRSAIGNVDHPLANLPTAPSITQLSEFFLDEGVKLSVAAAKKALAEAGLRPGDVTHVVSTTCTNSANPGFDHFVCRALGIGSAPHSPVEKVLLHGVGCSGGLAALRTAANLLLGASFRGRKARALVLATEISSLLVRSELDSIHESQETRIGVALFSDCAGAVVLSNGIEDSSEDSEGEGEEGDEGDEMREEEPIYELLGWEHRVVPDTEKDLGFDVDPLG
jgi:type III polyketide synthase